MVTQIAVMRAYGLHTSLSANAQITAIFTIVSVIRSYVLRRVFNKIHLRSATRAKSAKQSNIIHLKAHKPQ